MRMGYRELGGIALLAVCCGGGGHGSSGNASSPSNSGGAASSDAGATAGTDSDSGANGSDAQAAGDGETNGFIPPSGPRAQQAAQIYGEGSQAYAHGDFPSAAQSFRRAYELYPAPEMAYNVARVYERMGEVQDAIHFFDIVRNSHPSPEQRADIERREAALRAYEQRRREGIAQSMPSTDALSQEGNTWFQRGVTFYRRHQYREALLAFEQAYNYLQTPELFFNLAVTHEHLNNFDRAVEFMREYLQARRGTPEEAYIQQRVDQLEARRR